MRTEYRAASAPGTSAGNSSRKSAEKNFGSIVIRAQESGQSQLISIPARPGLWISIFEMPCGTSIGWTSRVKSWHS